MRAAVQVAMMAVLLACFGAAQQAAEHWVGTWAAAEQMPPGDAGRAGSRDPDLADRTVRMVVRVSLGGSEIRLRFSNAFGAQPARIGAARVALAGAGSAIVPGSDHALSFGGEAGITLPPGAEAISDPLAFAVPARARLAVSLYMPETVGAASWHSLGLETAYIAGPGDRTAQLNLPGAQTETAWYWLSGVAVLAPAPVAAVVAFGDSITDGFHSTLDADHRWPDVLAEQMPGEAVLNEGISGNRILHDEAGPNALARFNRDVLAQDGVRDLIVLEGINDIGFPESGRGMYVVQAVSTAEIIAGLQQIIARAHAHGIRVYGGTLTPYAGAAYATAAGEAKREAVNDWIRTSGAFDGVIDFDQVTRDPSHPTQFLSAYDSGDHLHPNDAGYAAMGRAAARVLEPGLRTAGR